LTILSAIKESAQAPPDEKNEEYVFRKTYLESVKSELQSLGLQVEYEVQVGSLADATKALVEAKQIDMVITSTRGKSGRKHWLQGGVSSKLMSRITKPVLMVQAEDTAQKHFPRIKRILVALDGSILSEETLPYARALGSAFNSEIILLSVPQVPEAKSYRAAMNAVRVIRRQTVETMQNFLGAVSRSLRADGLKVNYLVKGSLPVRTIVTTAKEKDVDLILMTSHGRGGLERFFTGSVAERTVDESDRAVLMVPVGIRD
jgi:nucleotide-binding universal stress UspA family protein